MWLDRFNQLGQLIATAVVIWSCLKTFQAQPKSGFLRVWFQLCIYYARYFMLWVMLWSGLMLLLPIPDTVYLVTLGLAGLYVYASWLEPNQLKLNFANIYLTKSSDSVYAPSATDPNNTLNIAVVSDIHVGIFSGKPHHLTRLVTTLNQLDVSAVVITGDWLYHAGADILGQMSVLKALNKPCYTVLSEQDNDSIANEKDPQNRLNYVLSTLGINVINDTSVVLGGVVLIGADIKSNFTQNAYINLKTATYQPLLILTHDVKNLAENANYLLHNENPKFIIAGQTHGGQVYVPYLTNALLRAMTGTQERAGLSTYSPDRRSHYQVWTATGLGMTGLPFRLNCPPSIDVLTLYL